MSTSMSGPGFTLIPATAAHAALLAELHGESFDEGWSADSLLTTLEMPGAFGVIAVREDDDEPLGFALFRAAAGESEVLTIATRPDARGQGVGRALMEGGLEGARQAGAQEMFLEVAADNLPAIGLYLALDFQDAGTRTGYYARPDGTRCDARVLKRGL